MKSFIYKPSLLRSAVLIILALIIGLGIAVATYISYCYQESRLKSDDVDKIELTIDENGNFSGKFRSEKTGRSISGIKYKVKDGNLYITVLATMGEKKALEPDVSGYVLLTINELPEINEIYYINHGKDETLSFSRS